MLCSSTIEQVYSRSFLQLIWLWLTWKMKVLFLDNFKLIFPRKRTFRVHKSNWEISTLWLNAWPLIFLKSARSRNDHEVISDERDLPLKSEHVLIGWSPPCHVWTWNGHMTITKEWCHQRERQHIKHHASKAILHINTQLLWFICIPWWRGWFTPCCTAAALSSCL